MIGCSDDDTFAPMSIGFVGPVPPIRGGIAQHGARLIEALRAAGHEVKVHSWRKQYPSALYRRPERDDEAVALQDVSWSLRWSNPLRWWQTGWSLQDCDRLVLPWSVPFHAPAYRAIMAASAVPTTIIVHNARPHERFPGADAISRSVFERAGRLVVHAASVAATCRELAPGVPVIQTPMPPPGPAQRPEALPRGPFRLLALGYLREYKGTDLAIRAIRVLADAGVDVRLTVAGEPWDGDAGRWKQLVGALQLDDLVELRLRYQSDAEVHDLLCDHHALVAPYRSASQSGVVAQAMAAGRPVVASRVGGLPDLVIDGVSGVLVEPEDVEALARGVERLMGDVERLARGAASTALSWTAVAASVLGGRSGRGDDEPAG